MKERLIEQYVSRMTINDVSNFAVKNGVNLNQDEVEMLYNKIVNNWKTIVFGTIGFENLINIIYNERLKDVPKILETPYVINPCTNKKEYPPYKFEIEMIKNKKMNKNLLNDIITYYK